MSLSLSQKLDESVTFWKKLLIAFGNTDEIFAVAMNHQKSLTLPYMLGLQSLPIVGWTLGTFLGAIATGLMPTSVSIAMNVMLYGMFIAIVVPVVKESRPVLIVACLAILFSCLFYYIPFLHQISEGITIIICTVLAAVIGVIVFPIKAKKDKNKEDIYPIKRQVRLQHEHICVYTCHGSRDISDTYAATDTHQRKDQKQISDVIPLLCTICLFDGNDIPGCISQYRFYHRLCGRGNSRYSTCTYRQGTYNGCSSRQCYCVCIVTVSVTYLESFDNKEFLNDQEYNI